ncbi:hypothetical protein BDV12DRAFT_31409 [Aspergillus spectabilis]
MALWGLAFLFLALCLTTLPAGRISCYLQCLETGLTGFPLSIIPPTLTALLLGVPPLQPYPIYPIPHSAFLFSLSLSSSSLLSFRVLLFLDRTHISYLYRPHESNIKHVFSFLLLHYPWGPPFLLPFLILTIFPFCNFIFSILSCLYFCFSSWPEIARPLYVCMLLRLGISGRILYCFYAVAR